MTTARVTQAPVRVVSDATPKAQITQATIRVVSTNTPDPVGDQAKFFLVF